MGNITSSRFDEALRRAIVDEAKATLAAAQREGATTKRRGRTAMLLGLPLALAIGGLMGEEGRHPRSRLAFGEDTLISADSQGVGGGVEELLPPSPPPLRPVPEPSPSPWLATARPAHRTPNANRITPGPRPTSSGSTEILQSRPGTPVVVNETAAATEDLVADETPVAPVQATPAPPGVLLNVGSRFEIVLDLPIQTGPAGAPVSGTTPSAVGGTGAFIPPGSRVVGEAIATTADDRVQVLLRAVVIEGKTIPLDGVALGPDGAFGVAGKVVRKGSKGRAGLGRVMGSLGSALTFGLAGGGRVSGGLVGGAAGELAAGVGRDLEGLERSWERSDKVIRVPAGARVTVFLRRDLVLGNR